MGGVATLFAGLDARDEKKPRGVGLAQKNTTKMVREYAPRQPVISRTRRWKTPHSLAPRLCCFNPQKKERARCLIDKTTSRSLSARRTIERSVYSCCPNTAHPGRVS